MGEGVMVAMGPCYLCREPFVFDPDRVPSILVDPASRLPCDIAGVPLSVGDKEPICDLCVPIFEAKRRELGRPPAWPDHKPGMDR